MSLWADRDRLTRRLTHRRAVQSCGKGADMRAVEVLALAAGIGVLVAGCGESTVVKKGDRFEVLEDLRVTANTEWEQPYADGFATIIPKGTVIQARFTTTPGASFFECVPVEVNRSKNQVAIVSYFVPEQVRKREGFKGFSFSLAVKDIGTKYKRLEK